MITKEAAATHGLLARCSKQQEGSAPGAPHKPCFGGAFLFGNNHVCFVAAIFRRDTLHTAFFIARIVFQAFEL